MGLFSQTSDEAVFDLRTLEAKLASGQITQKQYEQFLHALPNEEDNFDILNLEEKKLEN